MSQEALFDFGQAPPSRGNGGPAPSEEDVGRAVLVASRMAVRKRLRGPCPPDLDSDDLAQEVAILSLPYVRRWREGGKHTLFEYAYCTACNRLMDFFGARAKERRKREADDLDVLNSPGLLPLDESLHAMQEAC